MARASSVSRASVIITPAQNWRREVRPTASAADKKVAPKCQHLWRNAAAGGRAFRRTSSTRAFVPSPMPKFKGKPSRSKSPAGPRGGGSGYSGCDTLLVPRIQEYARSNDIADVDDVVEHLRSCYREYLRKPMLIFRKGVERAIDEVRKRGPPLKPSVSIEDMEAAHLERRGLKMAGEAGDDSEEESDDESGSDEDSDEDELEGKGLSDDDSDEDASMSAGDAPGAGDDDDARVMNGDLAKLYGSADAAEAAGAADSTGEKAAFAAPHLVAAAAQRALASQKKEPAPAAPGAGGGVASGATNATATDTNPNQTSNGPASGREASPPMSAAEAGHIAAVATARAARLREMEQNRSGRGGGAGARNNKKNKRNKRGGRSEFGEGDFIEDYLPGGKKYRKGGSGNGPGDPFGLEGGGEGAGGGSFAPSTPREVRLSDLGGIEDSLRAIRELILCPLVHPELYSWLGVDPPRGVLLHGPPGCGKTTLAHAIAREAGVPFFSIAAPEIVAGVSGESEAKIRQLFAAASAAAPSIVFIDEVDAIVPKRESAGRQMESRIVAQLLASMDALNDGGAAAGVGSAASAEATDADDEYAGAAPRRAHVTVIGATNRPDGMDAAMRRAGRFDREIMLGIPDEAARGRILAVQAKKLRLAGGLDLAEIARRTPGYVGADLSALAKEAAASAVSRIFTKLAGEEGVDGRGEGDGADGGGGGGGSGLMGGGRLGDRRPLDADELSSLAITTDDFAQALTRVQPSAQREGFTTTPEVTWEDVGSLTEVREELAFSVVEPIAHPARFQAMGLAVSTGVLLYGPPGCGKTLVAKATANEANANFISIKGPELLNKYVGESERAVRTLFARARAAAPCVLFFDELDSLAPRRGNDSGNQASERVVNQLLTEMDGLEARSATFVVAATNRPDMIDPAMLRPGRLDKLLYVPLPPPDGRAAILRTLTRKTPLAPGLDVASVGESGRCNGFSGADLASLVREACVAALKGNIAAATAHDEARERARIAAGGGEAGAKAAADAIPAAPPPLVTAAHFEEAFKRVQPSVSAADQRRYDELRRKLRRERGSLAPKERKQTEGKDADATMGAGSLEASPAAAEDSGGSAGRVAGGKGYGASSKKRKA